MTTLFLDTEFTGLTQDTSLISLAIVDENRRTFYAELTDFNKMQVTSWLEENVLSHLLLKQDGEKVEDMICWVRGTKEMVTDSLVKWLSFYKEEECQFVADVLMYDWVLFAELFGGALHLPAYIHFMPLDFSTILYCRGIDRHISRQELLSPAELEVLKLACPSPVTHNALFDTYLLKRCFEKLTTGV